jgi:hypothetical protein
VSTLAELEEHILHSDRRSREQQGEDVAALMDLLSGDEHAALREKVLHRWRFKEGPAAILAEALAAAKPVRPALTSVSE